jgi:uncharacterized Zn finger protein
VQSVADLVEEAALRRLAPVRALERGRRAADAGAVELADFGPLVVRARVGEERHEVVLRSTEEGLRWSCTCPEGKAGGLCEHAAAAAIETWRRSPRRRG